MTSTINWDIAAVITATWGVIVLLSMAFCLALDHAWDKYRTPADHERRQQRDFLDVWWCWLAYGKSIK